MNVLRGSIIKVEYDEWADPSRDFDCEIVAKQVEMGTLVPYSVVAVAANGEVLDSIGSCYYNPDNLLQEVLGTVQDYFSSDLHDLPIVVDGIFTNLHRK